MQKRNMYTATVVNTRNEFIDAARDKTPVMIIEGELQEEIVSEIYSEMRYKEQWRKLSNGAGVGTVVSAAVAVGAGVAAIVASAGLFFPFVAISAGGMVLGASGAASSVITRFGSISREHILKYDWFEISDPPTIGLVYRSKYNYENDSIVSPINLRLCDGNNCPKCGRKLEKEFSSGYCDKCGTKLAVTFKPK